MSGIVLQVENLTYVYPNGECAVKDVSFQIEKGQKVFFHGANGAGKTTLFQCLAGLLCPQHGVIRFDGRIVTKASQRMNLASIVFQNADDQIIAGSVFEEIAFGPMNQGLSHDEIHQRVENAMRVMNIVHLREKPPHFLSYGEKKRVCIASVLSMNRPLLILDEPTAGLDTRQKEELVETLQQLSDTGHTLLIASHDTDFSFRNADRVVVLDHGVLLGEGTAVDVFSRNDVLNQPGLVKPVMMCVYETLLAHSVIKPGTIPKCANDLSVLLQSAE